MPLLVAGATVAGAIALVVGLWIYFSRNDGPNERAAADSDATKAGSSAAGPAQRGAAIETTAIRKLRLCRR